MSEPADEPQEPVQEPTEPVEPDEPGPSDDEALTAEEDDEPDNGEPEDVPADEPTTNAEPESPTDRKRMQAAGRAVTAYANKIGQIFEDQAGELHSCPLCGDTVWPGFVHLADAGRMPDVTKNAVMQFLGYARERDYPQSARHRPCPACQASGKVSTGSQVPNHENVTCGNCKGYGYVPPPGSPENGEVTDAGVVTGPTMVPSGAGVPDVDPWGDPRLLPDGRENPNYGKMPQYKVPIEPWGTTANLTVQDAVT